MARKLAEVRALYEQINRGMQHLNAPDKQALTPGDIRYFTAQKKKFHSYGQALAQPKWFDGYEERVDFLILEIKALLNPNLQHNSATAKKRVLYFAFLAAQRVVGFSLDFLATKNVNHPKQVEHLSAVVLLQRQIDDGLSAFFPLREKAFNLRLTELRQEFEEAYVSNYGAVCFSFFVLPVKRFFRRKSRDEELRFIENINQYLINHPTMLPSDRELIKKSALNLVRSKIQSEFFGESSVLSRLIDARLTEAGIADNEIMEGFLVFCVERRIRVPEELASAYEVYQERPEPQMGG